jgi:hypothetical protein
MFFFKVTLELHYHVNHVEYVNRTTNKSTNAEEKKTSMKKIIKIAMFSVAFAAMALSATANASVLYSGTYDGTYTSEIVKNTSLSSFTATAGYRYGISATINASPFTATAVDQTGNQTYFGFSGGLLDYPWNAGVSPNYGAIGANVNIYAYGGQQLFLNPITYSGGAGTPGNLMAGNTSVANPYGPLNVGLLLDTTQATWSLSYYYGGTGFNDTAVYQGGSLLGTTTALDPLKVRSGIYFTYLPSDASGAQAQSIVSNFRVVDSIPEPSTWTMMMVGIGSLIMFRRRRAA